MRLSRRQRKIWCPMKKAGGRDHPVTLNAGNNFKGTCACGEVTIEVPVRTSDGLLLIEQARVTRRARPRQTVPRRDTLAL